MGSLFEWSTTGAQARGGSLAMIHNGHAVWDGSMDPMAELDCTFGGHYQQPAGRVFSLNGKGFLTGRDRQRSLRERCLHVLCSTSLLSKKSVLQDLGASDFSIFLVGLPVAVNGEHWQGHFGDQRLGRSTAFMTLILHQQANGS